MFDKGLFGGMFDFNNDGKMDPFEKAAEFATFMHIVHDSDNKNESASEETMGGACEPKSYKNAAEDALIAAGYDLFEIGRMDDDELAEALEDIGLDPETFGL